MKTPIGSRARAFPSNCGRPVIPVEVFATAYWAHCVELVAQMAQATARDSEATQLRELHAQIIDAFNVAYVRPDARIICGGGNYDSVVGRVSTNWRRFEDGRFSLEVTVPANASARVHLSASPDAEIHESRKSVAGRSDIQLLHRSESELILDVGSGSYRFIVQ